MKKIVLLFLFTILLTSCKSSNDELDNIKEVNQQLVTENEVFKQEIVDLSLEITQNNKLQTEQKQLVKDLEKDKQLLEEEIIQTNENLDKLMLESEELEALVGPIIGAPLLLEATNILLALQADDMATLSLYINLADGLRLSPYQFVDLTNDIVLTPTEVANLFSLPTAYTWGNYDGSGDAIVKTAALYYDEFIYDEDFLVAPLIGQNVVITSGNMINNIVTQYPGLSFVEFYFPGFNIAYDGLDWKSLTLVMKNIAGQWYLVGIVHGQWTI